MKYNDNSPFYKLLATKYKKEDEALGIAIVEAHPEVAKLAWHGPDEARAAICQREYRAALRC